ncbi:hypothetical protein BG452_03540 [Streptomyces sp. CBMA123]|nr:hypothetical protein [Streptomyces sp. CBMA123]
MRAVTISQVQRSAASASRGLGAVQPGVCLIILRKCSMSNLRRNACQARSVSAGPAVARDHHSHSGLGSPPLGGESAGQEVTGRGQARCGHDGFPDGAAGEDGENLADPFRPSHQYCYSSVQVRTPGALLRRSLSPVAEKR